MLPTVFGENLFDDFFDDSFGMMNAHSPLYGKHARNLMKTDIRETDTNYELAIDLPGFKKDEIHIELKNGYLTISASKGLDRENGKISLGYKRPEDNPWVKLEREYPVGTVCDAKIVGMTQFGAFASVIPGIDGLIHISQIADHRIEKPQDVLKIGDEVKVKITDIDFERHRVSLSIRALLEEQKAAEDEAASQAPAEEVVYSTEAAEEAQPEEQE
mgnify:CR=1 FL=1